MNTLKFEPTAENFINVMESIGVKVSYLSSVDKTKHTVLINTKKCIINFGTTFISIFRNDGKAQIVYDSKNNQKESVLCKIEKLIGISIIVPQTFSDTVKPIKQTSTNDSIVVGSDQFTVDYIDHNWGLMKELKHLGCEFVAKDSKFVCPSAKQSNISEVLNHYNSNSKGLSPSQRDKRDKLMALLPLDCEFKKDEKGLWIININYLAEKKQIQDECKKVGFKYVRSVNGVRHLVK